MTYEIDSPGEVDLELTLLGPGYGESIVLHVGKGVWVVVDSCLVSDGIPGGLRYLESIGVDTTKNVALIVATHWHDDHIRGMARLVEMCPNAKFCCAGALCREEFLTLVGALEGRYFSATGSGLREIHRVFSLLEEFGKKPVYALANRVIFRNDVCTISSLSPGDGVFQNFLKSVEYLVPRQGDTKKRIRDLSPNEVCVALWIDCGECSLLLGADLERTGWVAIVGNSVRPAGYASVFKVPHHGSENAHEPTVWEQMLEHDPFAVLTPWRRGRGVLPTQRDADRILQTTSNAWITNSGIFRELTPRHENRAVEKTLREIGVRFRPLTTEMGMVRLRRTIGSDATWQVEVIGGATHLNKYAA